MQKSDVVAKIASSLGRDGDGEVVVQRAGDTSNDDMDRGPAALYVVATEEGFIERIYVLRTVGNTAHGAQSSVTL